MMDDFIKKRIDEMIAHFQPSKAPLPTQDWAYALEQMAGVYDLVEQRYACFRVGDRVKLASTPVIDEQHSPGWIGSKCFLVKGAVATVMECCIRPKGISYHVVFDNESWINSSTGELMLVDADRRQWYTFGEEALLLPGDATEGE
jgi:hypothetical protein